MSNLKNQLHKAYRYEESIMKYYQELANKMQDNLEVQNFSLQNVDQHQRNLEEIKRLLKKYCST